MVPSTSTATSRSPSPENQLLSRLRPALSPLARGLSSKSLRFTQSGSLGSTVVDYYELLGVRRDASERLIRSAVRIRLRECHPDAAGANANPEELAGRSRLTASINQAGEVLLDPAKRKKYDRQLVRGPMAPPTPAPPTHPPHTDSVSVTHTDSVSVTISYRVPAVRGPDAHQQVDGLTPDQWSEGWWIPAITDQMPVDVQPHATTPYFVPGRGYAGPWPHHIRGDLWLHFPYLAQPVEALEPSKPPSRGRWSRRHNR